MDARTILATLAVLASGPALACGADVKKEDAKEVPHAKDGDKGKAKADGEKASAKAEGEMSCAPGQCGEGTCGEDKKAEDKPADDKALADGEKDGDKPAEAAEPKKDPNDPAT
jgi:hypothetical protein